MNKVIQIGSAASKTAWDNPSSNRVYDQQGISPTLNTCSGGGLQPSIVWKGVIGGNKMEYKIRRLTPRETWRLMDFPDWAFDKASNAGISNSQLYKQAGNSICVGVVEKIFEKLYDAMPYLFEDLKVCSCFSGIGAFEMALKRLYETKGDKNGNSGDAECS